MDRSVAVRSGTGRMQDRAAKDRALHHSARNRHGITAQEFLHGKRAADTCPVREYRFDCECPLDVSMATILGEGGSANHQVPYGRCRT